MRISKEHIQIIKDTVEEMLGDDAQVLLFGSRVKDDLRGGDIDLMVTTPHSIDRPVFTAARLATRLERNLDGRRVDVILVTPDTKEQPIHSMARQNGILL